MIRQMLIATALGVITTSAAHAGELRNGQKSDLATIIPNFSPVTEKLYRGAAPSDIGLIELKQQGIKTIIDLRRSARSTRKERENAQTLGMTYVHLPMGYGKPSETDLKEFLSIVQNPVYQPVYVHCRQGADRTGTLVAAYRLIVQKWSMMNVYAEMRKHHFKPWLFPLRKTVKQIAESRAV